ncbi:MAG: ABC transporter permease subunit, partial [bacterium]|nr:ABC transporter permease subunit [bacterium]
MLYELMKFEFFFRMKKISTYIYFGIFFLFSFLAVLSMGGAFKDIVIRFNDGGQGNVFANAPYVIDALVRILSIFGLMITAGMMGNAAYRDFEQKTHNLYFSYPITKFGYMAGRFVGTILTLLFVFSSIGIGAMLATMMPFVDADKIGPFQLMAYVLPYIFAVIPNLVFSGAIFYTLALKVRKRLPVYVSSVGMLMGYLVGLNLASDVENKFIAAIIEPFGAIASGNITEYWTTAEKNSLLIPFSGDLLLNRLLWLGISFLILWFAGRKFKLSYLQSEGKKAVKEETSIEPDSPAVPRIQPVTKKVFSATLALKQFFYLVKMEFLGIVKNIYFLAIVLFGVAFVLLSGFQTIGRIFGTHTYPVTYQVLQITAGLFTLFVLIVVTFYSGELVWRERDKKFNQINDAMPVASWIPFTSKLSALMLVQVALCFIILICGLTIQIFKGYTHFELGLYFQALFSIRIINYLLFAVLAMFVQVLVHHKYMGHFIMVVYYIVSDFLPALGLEHLLFRYPEATIVRYSDMNGYGHFLGPYYYFKFYWIAMAILLAIVSHLFWVRGTDTTFKIRLRKIKGRFSRGPRILAAGALSLLLTLGSIIIYNTTILNDFETRAEGEEKRVSYEKDYKKYENIPQPRVTDVRVDVDIYPYQRRAVLRGSYVLTNKTPGPIKDIHITINPAVVINSMQLDGGSKITTEDKKRGY